MIGVIAGVTLKAALGRRRLLMLALFSMIPVLLVLLLLVTGSVGNASGGPGQLAGNLWDTLFVRVILPLVALVTGTSVLGSELEDGTAVYLLARPIPRWQIIAGKAIVACGLTAVLAAVSAVLTVLLLTGGDGYISLTIALGVAAAIGGVVYALVFVALSVVTTRAFIVGLIYSVVWEGILAGLFEGTRILSVRQYTVGIASGMASDEWHPSATVLDPGLAVGAAIVVAVGAFAIATLELQRNEVRPAD